MLSQHSLTGAQVARTPRPAIPAPAEERTEAEALLDAIRRELDRDGAEDILDIDLDGKSTMADFMVIASGRSTRHVAALAEKLVEMVKETTGSTPRAEGRESADWVLLDAGDVVVHIFRPEVREFYQLEKMWLTQPDTTARHA